MNKEILAVAESVSNEKSIPKETIFKLLEISLTSAIKKKYKKKIDIIIKINRNNGEFNTYKRLIVVKKVTNPKKQINIKKAINKNKNIKIGDYIENKIKKIYFDRITTQTAKKIIIKKIIEEKKNINIKKIKKKKWQIITGFIKKIYKNYILIDIGYNTEAKILKKDMIKKEKFKIGKKIKSIIYDIKKKNNNYEILLSRSKKIMLIELLKIEIPEIKKKIIKIKAISRNPGFRSKIAVKSNDKKIDPIGSCVGIKGSRIKWISHELSGEKIDIILWNKNIKKFIKNIISPAKINNIFINKKKKIININVEISKLAQIIGKNGQNIKLSSKLIGWDINILNNKQYKKNKN